MAELLSKKVLFAGQGEIQQLDAIFKLLGTPTEDSWPGHKKLKVMERVRCCTMPCPPLPIKAAAPQALHDMAMRRPFRCPMGPLPWLHLKSRESIFSSLLTVGALPLGSFKSSLAWH